MDAIHVATAVKNRVPVLYTFDAAKNRRKGLLRHDGLIGLPGAAPLRIEVPPDPEKGTLFAAENKTTDSENGDESPTQS
jgi:hypothetical protein